MASSWNKLHRACIKIDTHSPQATGLELKKIEMLCLYSCGVDEPTSAGNTALHLACTQSSTELVRLLLRLGADPEAENDAYETPLHHSLMHGRIEVIEIILEQGVDVNVPDQHGCTPLHWALQQLDFNPDVVRMLLAAGANTAALDHNGDTALHYAAREGNTLAVDILLKSGCDFTIANREGMTAFHVACAGDDEDVVRRLLEVSTLDPNHKTTLHGLGPLHIAARSGTCEVLELLLAMGVNDVDETDSYGRTPLHIAAKSGQEDIACRLVEVGAARNVADTFDKTPLEYAMKGKHNALAPLLKASAA